MVTPGYERSFVDDSPGNPKLCFCRALDVALAAKARSTGDDGCHCRCPRRALSRVSSEREGHVDFATVICAAVALLRNFYELASALSPSPWQHCASVHAGPCPGCALWRPPGGLLLLRSLSGWVQYRSGLSDGSVTRLSFLTAFTFTAGR